LIRMTKIEEYRAHADECRTLAHRARSEDKALMLDMASLWDGLMSRQARMDAKRDAAPNAANDDAPK
jgi:hypothetical protein